MENNTPQTLIEAIRYFADPDTCIQFMIPLRWPEGIICPRCGSREHSYLATRRIWKCKGCKKQFSIKVGTVMEDSPIKLDKWLAAIWMIANDKNGISSYEIHRGLGITQKSAWFLLHRIRLAMQTGTFQKLSGTVEADETFIGGKSGNMHKSKREERIHGTGAMDKTAVMGTLQRTTTERVSQVKATVVPNVRREAIHAEVRKNVEPGAHLYTDSLPSYRGLAPDYVHKTIDHAVAYAEGKVHTNGMENFWSLLKRMVKGTYIHMKPENITRYVDEEAFRFNERDGNDGTRFVKTLSGVKGKRLTYKRLIGKSD